MITKLYWAARIIAYIVCFAGVFTFLYHQADADPAIRNWGLAMVGIGFFAFFISYALRAWLRFGPARRTDDLGAP